MVPGGKLYAVERLCRTTTMMSRLKMTARGLAGPRAPVGGTLLLASVGDSWTASERHWVAWVAESLQPLYGSAGEGWFSFSGSGAFVPVSKGEATTFSRSGPEEGSPGSWRLEAPNLTKSRSPPAPDLSALSSSVPGDRVTFWPFQQPGKIRLFIYSGGIRYRYNGGSWRASAAESSALQVVDLAPPPESLETIDFEVVSGTVRLAGLDLQKRSVGVRFHNLGRAGTHTNHWVACDRETMISAWRQLGPHLVILFFGINDQGHRLKPSQSRANIEELIERARAAVPDVDVLVVTSPGVRDGSDLIPMTDYSRAHRAAARNKKVAHLDLQSVFGDFEDYRFGGVFPLLDHSHIHPNKAARGLLTETMLRVLIDGV